MNAPIDLKRPRFVSWRRPRTLAVAGALSASAVLFLAGYLPRHRSQGALVAAAAEASSQVPRVAVVRPRPANNARQLKLPGTLEALEATAVYARANGYVRRWRVDIGDRVEAGQLLAEIDTPELDQQLQHARATLEQLQAALEQATANERYADITATRYQTLATQHFVSQQDLDQSQAQAAVGVANVRAARSAIDAQTANVHQLEQLKAFARVVAPFGGVITERNIERGTLVTPGNAAASPLYRIAITNPLRVFVKVPQAEAAGVAVGANVTVRAPQHPERTFAGKVTRSAGALDPATRTLTVEAQVANDEGALFAGSYADVTVSLGSSHAISVVPATALLVDAQGVRVATVDARSVAQLVPVRVGRDLGQEVEIVDGLTGSENVITAPPADLADGEPVALVEPRTVPAATGARQ